MADSSRQPAMFCLDCRYPLHSLESHECPECGRAFDPETPESYAHIQRPRLLSFDAIAAPICAAGFWVLVLRDSGRRGGPDPLLEHLPGIVFFALAIGFGIGALRRRGWRNKLSAVLTLVATTPFLVFVLIYDWRAIWDYWTYWHWLTPAW